MEEGSPQVTEVAGTACGQVKTGIVCVACVYVCMCVYVVHVDAAFVCVCVCVHMGTCTLASVCVSACVCVPAACA